MSNDIVITETPITQRALEPEEELTLEKVFNDVAGVDGEIDSLELKKALDIVVEKVLKLEFQFNGFSNDVCRSMFAMLDADQSGKLTLGEFKSLWKCIAKWKDVFIMYDHSKSGYMNLSDLQLALDSAGFSMNNKILKIIMNKYGDKKGRIEFDDFLMCTVKLTTTMDTIKRWATKKLLKFAIDVVLKKILHI